MSLLGPNSDPPNQLRFLNECKFQGRAAPRNISRRLNTNITGLKPLIFDFPTICYKYCGALPLTNFLYTLRLLIFGIAFFINPSKPT
jgi:hypothetical protein